jgi:hypothetical protein
MAVFGSSGPRPQAPQPESDRSSGEARHELAQDIRALNHLHSLLSWGILVETGELLVECGCDKKYRRASDPHWASALRKVRGLDRLPPLPKNKK